MEDLSPLHAAVRLYDWTTAKSLIDTGFDINEKDKNGKTVLHILVEQNINLINLLRSPDHCSTKKITADGTEKMVSYDTVEKLRTNENLLYLILANNITDYDCPDDIGLTKLHVACILRDYSSGEKISSSVFDFDQRVNENSPLYAGYTALHFAAQCSIETVITLVKNGANLLVQDAEGTTPLDLCIKSFSVKNVHSALASVPTWNKISFSGGNIRLLDYVYSLRDAYHVKEFLTKTKNIWELSLPKQSPLWPGSNILHVATFLLSDIDIQVIADILATSTDMVNEQDSCGRTPLHLAFIYEKGRILDLFLNRQEKAVNPMDEDSLSYMHIAAAVDNQQLLKRLLKIETNSNVAYKGKPLSSVRLGWTPLHTAAHADHANVAKMLLRKSANLLQTDYQGYTAIHVLFAANHTEKLTLILFGSDQLKECVVENIGLTHLHTAVWQNNGRAIERLLDVGADVEAPIAKLEDGQLKKFGGCRPIHVAMMGRMRPYAFSSLLKRGADIFARRFDEPSPLVQALTLEYSPSYLAPIVELLWSSKALQERCKNELGLTMLHVATYALDMDKVEKLLERGVDVNAKIPDDSDVWPGFTPLHALTLAGLNHPDALNVELFCCLIDNKANVTLRDAEGKTVAHMSTEARDPNDAYVLGGFFLKYQHDFSINPTNKNGMSHFHIACLLHECRIAQKLLKRSTIDINQQINTADNSQFAGHTPLLLALTTHSGKYYNPRAQLKMVKLLLSWGANVHAVDAFGYTPLHKSLACVTRNILWRKILIDNQDVNKRASDGKTPMEILLSLGASIKYIKYFVEHGARINDYNPFSDIGYIAKILTSNTYTCWSERSSIIKFIMDSSDIAEVNDNGRNAIHNAVASSVGSAWTYLEIGYRSLLEKLTARGCNIFQQDRQGRTALHLAVKFQNKEAVEALLEFGSNINIVDSVGKSAFSYASEFCDSNAETCISLAIHLKKLQLVGLQVSDTNAKLLSEVLNRMKNIDMRQEENILMQKLEEAKRIIVYDGGFTLRDFLLPTGVVNSYSSLKKIDCAAVDSFFASTLYERDNKLKCFIKLQYNNARRRPFLIDPAKKAFRTLIGFHLPDVCVDIILLYLTYCDLNSMIAATN